MIGFAIIARFFFSNSVDEVLYFFSITGWLYQSFLFVYSYRTKMSFIIFLIIMIIKEITLEFFFFLWSHIYILVQRYVWQWNNFSSKDLVQSANYQQHLKKKSLGIGNPTTGNCLLCWIISYSNVPLVPHSTSNQPMWKEKLSFTSTWHSINCRIIQKKIHL